jgi:CHAT domain-containing protein
LDWISQTGIRLISILGMINLWATWGSTDTLYFQPHPEVLPRIWWCATGPLSFLPIHAAGIYGPGAINSQINEYVISSYIPTLSALLKSSNRPVDTSFKLLSVIQPSAPGVSSIPNTKREFEYIQRHLGELDHVALNGHQGTKQRVMKAMSESNWLHLACHGSQRRDEPTKSALILEDGHLTLEEIIKLDLPKAEFAFLSACQTITGDESLSDEATHIAGGMLLAGYRGVVATMWSIEDDIAPEVADEFYRRIMEDRGRPDNRKAAEALHYSVERLRKKEGIPLISWIPFVHMGA